MELHRLEVEAATSPGGAATETDESSRLGFDFEATDDELRHQIATLPFLRSVTVGILGLGYVGLPTALSLLNDNVGVIGVDISPSRLRAIQERRVDLIGLDHERLETFVDDPAFVLTDDVARLREAEAVFICVPTPVDGHLSPDPFRPA